MVVLPIVERELRTAARKRRTWFGRLTGALISLAFIFWTLWILRGTATGAVTGLFLLKAISYIVFGICIFSGAGRAADAISSEKREDTLGLLFLTHLKGYDIVLGKLVATSLQGIYSLLAIVPITGVAMLLGGVTITEVTRVPVSLLNSLLLSLAIGLLSSTLLRTQRAATALTAGVVIVLIAGLPGTAEFLRDRGYLAASGIVSLFSPSLVHEMAFGPRGGFTANRFWTGIGVQFLMSLTVLGICSLLVPHVWKVRPAAGKTLRLKQRLEAFALGEATIRKSLRQRFLHRNPIFWLTARNRFTPWITPFILFVIALSVVASAIYSEVNRHIGVVAAIATLFVFDFFLKMRIAKGEAVRIYPQNGFRRAPD